MRRKIRRRRVLPVILAAAVLWQLAGCAVPAVEADGGSVSAPADNAPADAETPAFDLTQVPPYSGEASVPVHGNVPWFTEADRTEGTADAFAELDRLGRCGPAFAVIRAEEMAEGPRPASDLSIRPSGWHTVKYDGIDQNYLYNRCHLVGYRLKQDQLNNERNLITGTRYLNVEGMLPYENRVAAYVRRTGRPVLYRVTPVFEGENLLASGVLMEAESLEDDTIRFCVYCYNLQPGITIDYATGESSGPAFTGSGTEERQAAEQADTGEGVPKEIPQGTTYVINTGSGKFHRPECGSVTDMAAHNALYSTETREQIIAQGYEPCGRCDP